MAMVNAQKTVRRSLPSSIRGPAEEGRVDPGVATCLGRLARALVFLCGSSSLPASVPGKTFVCLSNGLSWLSRSGGRWKSLPTVSPDRLDAGLDSGEGDQH
jgi:hypothetical protein